MDAGRLPGDRAFQLRVEATRGLIECGADAIPLVLEMLTARDPEVREDAGGILGHLGRDDCVVDAVIRALEAEQDLQARDSLIGALGRLRNPRAIPILAKLLRVPEIDADTRFEAALSLGRIAHRRFDKQPDAVAAALEWLDRRHPTEP